METAVVCVYILLNRQFEQFLQDFESIYGFLLFHCEVLCKSKILKWFNKLSEEL